MTEPRVFKDFAERESYQNEENPDETRIRDELLELFKELSSSGKFNEGRNLIQRVVHNYNQKVRNRLSDRMGFNLSTEKHPRFGVMHELFENGDSRKVVYTNKISIRLVDKIPNQMLFYFEGLSSSELLQILRRKETNQALDEIAFQIRYYHSLTKFHKEVATIEELKSVQSHLDNSINEIDSTQLTSAILSHGFSVLGSYSPQNGVVELYWIPIILFSEILNEPIENIALATLIHELAHGYSHLGFDKDGYPWEIRDFYETPLPIIEGIAEYYTELLSLDSFDFIYPAFKKLKEGSSSEYRDYEKWIPKGIQDQYEILRKVLLECRRRGFSDMNQFKDFLNSIRPY